MIDVTIFFPEGTFSSTAIGPMEVFRHSGMLWNVCSGLKQEPRFRVTTVSIGGKSVECDGPLHIKPQADLKSICKADLIFIPSTGLSLENVAERNAEVIPWLKKWHGRGAAIAAVCSGVGLLAATGLLDGRRATTHWGLADDLRQKYPKVKWMPEFLVTEDAGFYCGGGVNASLDLSLCLVERFCGHDIAVQSAKALLIETPRTWQSGFAITPLRTQHTDDVIAKAQEWVHRHFKRNFAVDELAEHVSMSTRNFARRFKQATGDSPLMYLQKVRVAAAKRLLENEGRSLQEISDAVGYTDAAFFRSIFQRHTGESPAGYRRRFS